MNQSMLTILSRVRGLFQTGIFFLAFCLWFPQFSSAMVGIEVMAQKSRWTVDQLSVQEQISQSGTYLYLPLGSLAYFEAAQEQLDIVYKGAALPLKQGDSSAALNLLLGPMMLSAGMHRVKSSDIKVDGGKTTAYSASVPEIFHISLGFASYETEFPNFTFETQPDSKGLSVKQTSPRLGISFFDGSFSVQVQRDQIEVADSTGQTNQGYRSNQVSGNLWVQPFYLTYTKWTGKRLFYADNKALYLNSLSQVYEGGNRAAVTWMPTGWMDLAYIRTNEFFIEPNLADLLKSKIDTLNLTVRF